MRSHNPTPITAAEFARELVAKFRHYELQAMRDSETEQDKDDALVILGIAVQWSDAIEITRDLAAKHGVKLEGGE